MMGDLNLMHYDQLDEYSDAVSEAPDLEEIPAAEVLVRSLIPSTLTEKTYLRSDCRREATPRDEQQCVQQRKTYTRGASSAQNVCKTDRLGSDFSWDMIFPSVFDNEALASRIKLHETPIDDRERPQGNWNDDYSLSDHEGSLSGEQLSYYGSDEGNFYFSPTPEDSPRSFVPPPAWILTIYNHPCDDETDSLYGEEICYSDSDVYFKPTPADSPRSFVPGILTMWDEPEPETTHDESKSAEPQENEEVDFIDMIRQGLKKMFSFGHTPDTHSDTEERQRKYAERHDSADILSWSLSDEAILP
jgi:hypothetical protein